MRNTYIGIGVIVVVAILAFWINSKKTAAPVVDNQTSTSTLSYNLTDGTYALDTNASIIKWSVDNSDNIATDGTAALNSGQLIVANSAPADGTFEIDMNSVQTTDDNVAMANFLKKADYLNVDQFPTSTFKINKVIGNPVAGTSTGKYIIDGLLTLRGVTKDISFPITLSESGSKIVGDSSFALNKSDWKVGSDNNIKNAVSISLHIEASK